MNNFSPRLNVYGLVLCWLSLIGTTTPARADTLNNPQQLAELNQQLQRAHQLYSQQQLENARQHYQQVLQHLPANSDALLGLGHIALQQQQPLQAMFYLSQLLTFQPNHPLANAQLALLSGKTEQQEGLLQNLLQLQEHPSLYFALGNLYAEQQRWPEAQQAYSRANRLAPQQVEYQLNLAISLDHQGKNQEALTYYRQASQQQTNEAVAQRIRGLDAKP